MKAPLVADPMLVLALLLGVLALLFWAAKQARLQGLFKIVPLLVFCYFVPTALSNTGVIPVASPLYSFIRDWLLPASLILLTIALDLPAIARLGRLAVLMFLGGTLSVMLGGILAYAALGWLVPPAGHDQAWRGLAALCGSWIGGGANFTAVGTAADATAATLGTFTVLDVAIASTWMAVVLGFAGREKQMDARLGADRSAIDAVRVRVEKFQAEHARPTNLPALLGIAAVGLGGTALCALAARELPSLALPRVGEVVNGFTWLVLLASAIGVGISFTPLRRLEGQGASAVGSVFLYLLVASIGAKADFRSVFAPENLGLLAIVSVWMLFHVGCMLLLRRWLRAPIFFLGVGSYANIGGAASAPVVAGAFHPALAPVGVLLAILGYVLGTVCGLLAMVLLKLTALAFYLPPPA
jgi:uncharacterized membrane protein